MLWAVVHATTLAIKKPLKLEFKLQPTLEIPYPEFKENSYLLPEDSQTALKTLNLENDVLISSQATLVEIYSSLENISTHDDSDLNMEKDIIRTMLLQGLMQIYSFKKSEWIRQARIHSMLRFSSYNKPRIVIAGKP